MGIASAFSGFYLLTPDGKLAFHDERNRLVTDVPLTRAFRRHNTRFLQTYLSDPDAEGEAGPLRVAVVCRSRAKTKWSSGSLILETSVLRNLYWTKEMKSAELTEFQKRNQEQSIFRGMELLLEFCKDSMPGIPIYCPVLFDRGTTLGQYASAPTWGQLGDGRHVRVLEVLNLIATIAPTHRASPVIWQLLRSIHERVIRKDVRCPSRFAVTGECNAGLFDGAAAWYTGFNSSGAVMQKSAADAAQQTLAPIVRAARANRKSWFSRSVRPAGIHKIARRVEPTALRAFTRLVDLAPEDLSLIASETRLYAAQSGAELLKRGAADNGTFYLLDGKVRLEAPDGKTEFIESGTSAAQRPVAHLKPRQYSVTAVTPVTFLWTPDTLLKVVLNRYPMPGEIRVDVGFDRFSMLFG